MDGIWEVRVRELKGNICEVRVFNGRVPKTALANEAETWVRV